ncbi:MAG: glycosyltransferase family 25 protein [Pseudomonadota bacterium]
MQIFVLNLDKDHARMDHMKSQLDNADLPYERLRGVYGKEMSQAEWSTHYSIKKARWRRARSLSPAEVGCSLSHLRAYREIVRRNLPFAFILEDDAVISENLEELLMHFEQVLDPDESIAILFSDAKVDTKSSTDLPLGLKLSPIRDAYYASSYIITRGGAKALLADLYPVGDISDPWTRLMRYKVVDVRAITPSLIPQDQETFGSSTTEGIKQVLGEHPLAIPLYRLRRVRAVLWDFVASTFANPKAKLPREGDHPIDSLEK